jgi:iron complex outermembrane receptor protein
MNPNISKITSSGLITALCFGLASLANASTIDSVAVSNVTINEVVVTGTRNATDVRHLPMTISTINHEDIVQSHQASLLPIITEQVPGLFTTSRGIMGYGVSGGAAGTISLRGLSGGSGQLMVLIDGHPQYMGLMGHPIADAYQSFIAEKVEVLRGPSSVLYGSNAMGGVVNIVTRQMHDNGVKTNASIGYGSYNTLQSEITNRTHFGRFSSVVSGSYNRTDGHRDNMEFEQYGGFGKVGYELSRNWKVGTNVNVTRFIASQPGATTSLLTDADQRVTRGMTSVAIDNNYDKTSGSISLFYNWGNHWINDGYATEGGTPRAYRFRSHDKMAGFSIYQSAQFFTGNRITLGVDFYHVAGEAWNKYISGENDGQRQDIAKKHLNEIAGYLDFRQALGQYFTVDLAGRVDHNSRVGTEFIPQAGLSVHLPKAVELKASASKGFRYPTIREMYMFPPQNPDLEPERMWNYEIAMSQHLLDGKLSYGVNIFYIDGENMIMTVPRQGATPLNMNTGEIDNVGFELQGNYRINRNWAINANYSYLHMDNPVIAAPENKLWVGGSFTNQHWSVSSGIQYIAGLYTSVSPEVKENFVLWNIRGQYSVNQYFGVWVKGENLLAQSYEINAGFPMPRATVMCGINLNF